MIEKFIDGLPPILSHKVKQELMGKNDSINYENLTYGDILSTIKKLDINMCNDEKLCSMFVHKLDKQYICHTHTHTHTYIYIYKAKVC